MSMFLYMYTLYIHKKPISNMDIFHASWLAWDLKTEEVLFILRLSHFEWAKDETKNIKKFATKYRLG